MQSGGTPNIIQSGSRHVVDLPDDLRFEAKCQIKIDGTANVLQIAAGTDICRTKIHLKGRNLRITIGSNCRLKQGAIEISGDGSHLVIGDGTTWESGSIVVQGGKALLIGRDCMLSHDIMIRTSDSHGIFDRNSGELINLPQDVELGDHVWLGNSARVGKGIKIGSGAIISQASLVTKDVRENCAYGGVPATLLKENVVWSRTFKLDDVPADFRPAPKASAQT